MMLSTGFPINSIFHAMHQNFDVIVSMVLCLHVA